MGDLLDLIRGVIALIPNFERLLVAITVLFGIILIVAAVRDALRRQELGPGQGSWSSPMMKFVFGVFLVSFPSIISTLSMSIFGMPEIVDPQSVFTYAPESTKVFQDENSREAVTSILAIVQFIGLIAVVRGLFVLNAHFAGIGSRPTFGSGMTHLVGGIMAVNIPLVVRLFELLATGGGAPGG